MGKSDKPKFCVYSVISHPGESDSLFEIGWAVPRRDGEGFDVVLQAQPLNARLVLRSRATEQLPDQLQEQQLQDQQLSLAQLVDAFERAVIERCLTESGGKISEVLKRLNVPRRTL